MTRQPNIRAAVRSYAVSLSGVLAATLVRLLLGPLVGTRVPFILYLPAVLLGAWIGGWGGGLAALCLSALIACYLFITPVHAFVIRSHNDQVSLIIFVLVGLCISALGDGQRRAQRQAERAAADAQLSAENAQLSEAALRNSEERLLLALDGGGMGAWHWDLMTGTMGWPSKTKAFFGLPPDAETPPERLLELLHADDRERASAAIWAALDGGLDYHQEYRVFWPDGSVHWIDIRGRVQYDSRGAPVRMEGILQNIDERKRAEEERERLLQEIQTTTLLQRAFLRDVLASVTEGRLLLCDTPADLPPPLAPVSVSIALSHEGGLRELRHRARDASEGMEEECRHDLITAASEAAMNAIVHGGGGGMGRVSVDGAGTVQVRIEDQGHGIALASLPKATLARGFSTKASLGHGFKMMQQVDRVYVLTGPGGTTVVLEQGRKATTPPWL